MTELEALKQRLKLTLSTEELTRAFRHRSYVYEQIVPPESNERLEFLGDAVVDLVVREYLFGSYPERNEGEYTQIKSAVVSDVELAAQAKAVGLERCLLLGKGAEETDGRQRDSIIAAAFEAMVGLLFLHGGYEGARPVVLQCLREAIERAVHGGGRQDYKSLLQRQAQQRGVRPRYKVMKTERPPHRREFTVQVNVGEAAGVGKGHSKSEAEQAAAQELCHKLVKHP